MITVEHLGRLLHHVEYWFAESEDIDKILNTSKNFDSCVIKGLDKPIFTNSEYYYGTSAINDLELDKDTMFQQFSKNTKYEIKRSERECEDTDFIRVKVNSFEDIQVYWKDMQIIYESMYKSKGITHPFPERQIKDFINNHVLYFCAALYKGEIKIYHLYVVGNREVQLQFSFSDYRNSDESSMKQFIGRLNKRMHFEDMLYFKKLGIYRYNWGGISHVDKSLKGIDEFKLSFGGGGLSIV